MRLVIRAGRWAALCFMLSISLMIITGVVRGRRLKSFDPTRAIPVVVALAFPLVYAARPYQYATRMAAAFEKLARSTGGRALHGGFLDPDFDMLWSKGGVRAHLHAWIEDFTARGKHGKPPASARFRFRYVLELPPRSMKLRLEVRPETVLEAVAKMFGMQDLSLGQPDLDRQLIVQASDPDEYKRCLERGLGPALEKLLRPARDRTIVHLSFVPGRLVVQRTLVVKWPDQAEEQAVRELHDVALELAAAITGLDVEVLLRADVAEVTVLTPVPEGAACLVCGGEIEHAPVVCTRCETPHHHDCWEYNGACALYACGSREARRAERVAASAASSAAPPQT